MRRQILSSEEHNQACGGMDGMEGVAYGVDAIEFIKVDDYTTFLAEYTIKDGKHLVFHFFVTDEINALSDPKRYWKGTFAEVLNEVAPPFFKSKPPDLRAAYCDELSSWWLQSDGSAGKVLDADYYAFKFLEEFDKALDQRMAG